MSNCWKSHAAAYLITESTRITPTTATLIDHIYTTAQVSIAESFVSDLSVCVTLRVSSKISKKTILALLMVHLSTLTKTLFLHKLTTDLKTFYPHHLNVDDGSVFWFSLILKPLNSHAPIKT